jgi:hypothetical protein
MPGMSRPHWSIVMPHFMIRLSALPSSLDWIRANPRACFDEVRKAAASADGHLDGCWFTEDGSGIVAILHIAQDMNGADDEEIRRAFSQVARDFDIEIDPLATLWEVTRRGAGSVIRGEVDPVDLGSALSFPASDPPSWYLSGPAIRRP